MSTAKKTGFAVGMAAVVLLGLATGCGGGSDRSAWTWGCLTEADAGGAPAAAELATVPSGEIVRVWGETPAVVSLEVLGGGFTDIAPGVYAAGPDGTIATDDLLVDVSLCETESPDACAPIDATSIEITVLEDGARRVAYRATSVEGEEIEGSFVVGR